MHQGHECGAREAWRRYVRFDVDKVSTVGVVTDADGAVTPLGVRLIGEVEAAGSSDKFLGEDIHAGQIPR